MINRPRTAFVSIAAVAVSMIVLGTDARAKSGRAASPQKTVTFLKSLAAREITTGKSLVRRANALEGTINRLEIKSPSPRLARQIAADSKQLSKVVASLQANTNVLQATMVLLQTMPSADLTPRQQAQVSSLLSSIQAQVVSDKGVATPTR